MFVKEIIHRLFIRSMVVVAMTLMLPVFGFGMEGSYSGSGSLAAGFMDVSLQVTFHADTVIVKAHTSTMGRTIKQSETEREYKVVGNRIKVRKAQGVMDIWTLEDDGSITVPMDVGTIKLTRTDNAGAENSSRQRKSAADAGNAGNADFFGQKFATKATSHDLEGSYSGNAKNNNKSMQLQLTFHLDHTVTLKVNASTSGRTMIDQETKGEYQRDGNKINLTDATGSVVMLTMEDDGSITFPMPGYGDFKLTRTSDAGAVNSSSQRETLAGNSGFFGSRTEASRENTKILMRKLKAIVRNIATAEEAFYADHQRYASLSELVNEFPQMSYDLRNTAMHIDLNGDNYMIKAQSKEKPSIRVVFDGQGGFVSE